MTAKHYLAISNLITTLTIFGCGNADNRYSKTLDAATTPLQTADKQTSEFKSSFNIGGTYSFGDNVEKGPVGSIIVYPLNDNTALFYLDVCEGAPSYNLGQMFGQMTIKGNIGTYNSRLDDDDLNCLLKFEFKSGILKVTTNEGHDDCGFGYAVYADNSYMLIDNSIPKYFIDGQGDTTFFEGLTKKKYNNHFDKRQ